MKQYFNYFKGLFAVLAVLLIAYIGILTGNAFQAKERTNGECLTDERVFDYGDVLTDKEEQKLRDLIARREKKIGCDIVLITLNESLKEYAREKEADVPYEEFVRVYAEDFYDSNKFGYNKPVGDGVLLVDNWFREDNGKIYTWFCAVGAADEKYDSYRIDKLLDDVYEYIEIDPYEAYRAYVNAVYYDMAGKASWPELPPFLAFLAGLVSMLVFIAIHWRSKKGKKTVVASTYVNGGRPRMNRREDELINKVVTKRRIETSSSGSGGRSGGGGSHSHGGHHGGGGRSR